MPKHVDRCFAAVMALAAHGDIKQRLIRAYEDHLAPIEIDEQALPAIRESLAGLHSLMHRVEPLNGEGPICASVRKMSVVEADECAQRIVTLYGDMIRMSENAQVDLPSQADEHSAVPPFLIKSG